MEMRSVWRLAVVGVVSSAVVHCGGESGSPHQDELGQRTQASETVLTPMGIETMARLGQGRDFLKEELRAECVRSNAPVTIPTQEASLRFSSAMLRDEASEIGARRGLPVRG